jgi:hypothetical protein
MVESPEKQVPRERILGKSAKEDGKENAFLGIDAF